MIFEVFQTILIYRLFSVLYIFTKIKSTFFPYQNLPKSSVLSRGFMLKLCNSSVQVCADHKNVIQECENPIAEGDFKWIFAVTVQKG